MTETMIELAHRVRVETDHRMWGLGCRAVCSCGWESQWTCEDAEDALRAATDHVDTAIGPPDRMDRAMSAMLDLQDDLANIVLWLAENWSTDLPAPKVYSYSRDHEGYPRAGVRLLVYCPSAEMLRQAAERMGVPVTLNPVAMPVRYQEAVRDFGRVRIDAYTDAPETTE